MPQAVGDGISVTAHARLGRAHLSQAWVIGLWDYPRERVSAGAAPSGPKAEAHPGALMRRRACHRAEGTAVFKTVALSASTSRVTCWNAVLSVLG